MALFDMFAVRLNDTNHIEPIKVKKSDRLGSKKAAKGMEFIGRVTANTSAKAIAISETRLKSDLFTIGGSDNKPEQKIAIFCDINGVLDNYETWQKLLNHPNENDLTDIARLRILVCPDKLEKLVGLAIQFDADLVCTSEHRKSGLTIYDLVRSCLGMKGTKEQQQMVRYSKTDLFMRTGECTPHDTKYLKTRSDEILEYIADNQITHCIVLEDSHPIPEMLCPIFTNEHNGLGQYHFTRIESQLAEFKKVVRKEL